MSAQHERRPTVSVLWRDGERVIRIRTGNKWIEFYAARLPALIEALVNEQDVLDPEPSPAPATEDQPGLPL